MVFQAISKAETPHREFMATTPVKSEPLHNFSFTLLKWGKNQMNNHRYRRLVDSGREPSPLDHRSSSASEAESDSGSICRNDSESENRKCVIGSRSVRSRFSFSSCSSGVVLDKSQKNLTRSDADGEGVEEVRAKLLIRFRTGTKEESASRNKSAAAAAVVDGGGEGGGQVEESASKPWNLRPRRSICKAPIEIVRASKNGELLENLPRIPQTENQPKSLRLRGFAEAQNAEKKEKKRKFSITLSREEIEEDIFSMTGSKPSRRPKKRAKNIQKQLDNAFPGLWLAGITEDTYKIPDAPPKV